MASFSAYQIKPAQNRLSGRRASSVIHLFGRSTQVRVRTPIKHARVFNPGRPLVMLLSFILFRAAGSDSNLAISASHTGCLGQQRPFLYSPYQAGIDFPLIMKNIKREGEYAAACQPNAIQMLGPTRK